PAVRNRAACYSCLPAACLDGLGRASASFVQRTGCAGHSMRLYYPRSFPALLGAGLTLIALPLLVALVTNAISIDRLANRSQNAVYQAAQATQSSRRLAELITALERTARQIVILADRSLFDAYQANRKRLEQTVGELALLPLDAEQKRALDEIVQEEKGI